DQGFISKTSDGGSTWNPLAQSLVGYLDTTASIAVASDHAIYANLDDFDFGAVLVTSRDGGATWSFCGFNAEPGGNYPGLAGGITFDPATPTTVYVAPQFYGAYKSTDGCATWSALIPAP